MLPELQGRSGAAVRHLKLRFDIDSRLGYSLLRTVVTVRSPCLRDKATLQLPQITRIVVTSPTSAFIYRLLLRVRVGLAPTYRDFKPCAYSVS